MKRLIGALLLLTVMATSCYAAMEWPVDKHVFTNGLTLLTLEDHSTPSIASRSGIMSVPRTSVPA